MLSIILIMIAAGVAGGTINISLRRPDRFIWREWMWSVTAGVGAAFLIPLFLRIVASSLLSDILNGSPKPEDLFVFAAFCLLAAISSKAFIQTLSDRVLKEAREARQQAKETKEMVNEVEESAEQAKSVARIAQDTARYGLGHRVSQKLASSSDFPIIPSGSEPDDPWAGQFGGKSEANGRLLKARIEPFPDEPDYCSIKLTVCSTDPDKSPLEGHVQFHLHPTYKNDKPIVPVIRGKAELNIAAWGAFTVGAITDKGDTLLELDLSEHPDAQEPWRSL